MSEPNILTFYRRHGSGARNPSTWPHRWHLVAPNEATIAASTEGYTERRGAHENAAQVIGAGILAGHHVIPDADDRAAVMAAIEARYGATQNERLSLANADIAALRAQVSRAWDVVRLIDEPHAWAGSIIAVYLRNALTDPVKAPEDGVL